MNSSAVSASSPRRVSATVDALPDLWVRAAARIVMVALPLVITPWGRDAYSGPKVLVLYALTAAAQAGWLLSWLSRRQPRWIMTMPEIAVWAFFLASLLSSAASINPRLTFFGAPERYEGLLAIGSYLALYLIGAHFFGSAAGFRELAAAAGGAGIVVVAYGLLQLALPALFPGEAFIREWYGTLGVLRISSTLGSPIVFGGYLCLLIPLWIVLAYRESRWTRVIWLIGATAGYAALAATFTRAAWLGAAVGTVLLGLVAGRHLVRAARAVVAAAAIGIIAGAIVLTVTATPVRVSDRVTSTAVLATGSTAQRYYIWTKTLELVAARPWLGWGIETLREAFPYDRAELVRHFGLRPVIIDKAHNDLLQMAVSVGVPGAISYLAVWVAVVLAAVRVLRRETGERRLLAAGWLAAVVAYLVQVQFSLSTVALAPMVWLLAGSAAGWEAHRENTGAYPSTRAAEGHERASAAGESNG